MLFHSLLSMSDQFRREPARYDRPPSPQRELGQMRWDAPQARGRGRSRVGSRNSSISRGASRSIQPHVDSMQQPVRIIQTRSRGRGRSETVIVQGSYPPPVTKCNRSPTKLPPVTITLFAYAFFTNIHRFNGCRCIL